MILNGAVFDLKPGGDGAKLGRAFFFCNWKHGITTEGGFNMFCSLN